MAKVLGKPFGKVCSVVLAVLLLLGVAFAFVGCESDYPQIRITLTFVDDDADTDDTYVLNYRLNRKMYKQTVNHYIELIDAGFYDGTVIHDYRSDRMVGGGYTYEDTENADYLNDLVSLAGQYDALDLTPSVWADSSYSEALNTLYGETTANGLDIDGDGGYSNETGALGTYTYLTRSDLPSENPMVYAHATKDNSDRTVRYQYNSVTSLFYLYTGSDASADSNYCVFGVLADDDSRTRFDELLSAIDAYETALEENDETFTDTTDMRIDDPMAEFGYYDAEFTVPVHTAIVITSVKVTSY